jgi:iron complex transport system substrate-binding protein
MALVVILALLAGLALFSGCGRGKVTVTDDAGRQVALDRTPRKIVSMAPSNTEILFALGLGERVVGVTNFCNYPPEATGVAKVGDAWAPDYEKIVSLQPDLVLAVGTAASELVKGLEGYGLKVLVLQADTVDKVAADVELVGQVTGVAKAAKRLAADILARLAAVEQKTSGIASADRPSVFWILDNSGNVLWTVGPGSFVHDVILQAGGRNVAESTGQAYSQFSLEGLLEADPDVIIIPVLDPSVPTALAGLPGWADLTAVKNGRVYQVDPDIVSRPGPRIAEAVEKVAALLHPNLFGEGQ